MITQAPLTFTVAFIVMTGLIGFCFYKFFRSQLDRKNELITDLERKIAHSSSGSAIGWHITSKPIQTEQPKNYKLSQVPVVMEFNPENGQYFHQEDRPSDVSVVTERYREYYCTMFNDSDETLRNVSCEVARIITIKNRPNDVEIHPENVHDKLRYDVPPTFPVSMAISAMGREKLWLFSRLKKVLDNEPIRIVKGSKFFHDKKRVRKVFLRVTAENYLPKSFSVDVWVDDGLLRMTWIQPEQDL